ncbi:MAG: outer membrane lipoprotein chaperone LolA [Pseudomonadota bacterium]
MIKFLSLMAVLLGGLQAAAGPESQPAAQPESEQPPGVAADAASVALAGDEAAVILDAFSSGLTSYQADFLQEVYDDQGRLLERSWGNMSLATPAYLRWHYLGDFEQLIVADGEQVWNHDVDLEQVTVKDQIAAAGDSPLYVLMAPAQLDTLYGLTLVASEAELARIRLTPRESRSDFEWIELDLEGPLLRGLAIADAFGQRTLIQFSEGQRNPALDPQRFRFSPPEGVDVLSTGDLLLEGEAL